MNQENEKMKKVNEKKMNNFHEFVFKLSRVVVSRMPGLFFFRQIFEKRAVVFEKLPANFFLRTLKWKHKRDQKNKRFSSIPMLTF